MFEKLENFHLAEGQNLGFHAVEDVAERKVESSSLGSLGHWKP